jgi:hypothetical protein
MVFQKEEKQQSIREDNIMNISTPINRKVIDTIQMVLFVIDLQAMILAKE